MTESASITYDMSDIRAALRAADVEYTREYPGTEIECLWVTAADGSSIAVSPNRTDENGGSDNLSGIDIAWYGPEGPDDFQSNDWLPTLDALMDEVRSFLQRHGAVEDLEG
jgi:hypothetical protein